MDINNGSVSRTETINSTKTLLVNADQVTDIGSAFTATANITVGGSGSTTGFLYNPVGSGILVLVDRIFTDSGGAGEMYLVESNLAKTTGPAYGTNLRIGGADSLAQIWSAAGNGNTKILQTLKLRTTTTTIFEFPFPIMLEEGQQIALWQSAISTTTLNNIVWRELAA